jgi:hypothetical protein
MLKDLVETVDYKMELYRPTYGLETATSRKAGTVASSGANNNSSVNDNGAAKQTSANKQQPKSDNKSTTKPNLPLVMMQKLYPEQSATDPKPKADQEVVKAQTTVTKNSERSHQQAMAEAQAPEEPVGAEKITVDVTNEAAMQQKHVMQPRNVINMDLFGVDIDLDKMAGNEPPLNRPTIPSQQFNMQQAWAAQQLGGNAGYMHRVDNTTPPKPKKEKTPPDEVEVKIPDIVAGAVNPIRVKETVDPVPVPSVQPSTSQDITPEKVKMFDNNNMITRYDYLGEIERIALENKIQVQFIERADHMISVVVWNGNIPATNKGFTIDPGFIIDRRKKIFTGIQNFFEGFQAYPLFIGGGDKKQTLNEPLIKGLLIGGNNFPKEKEGLYREEYRDLNRYIDLSTIPSKSINGEDRKWIQNQLVAIYKKNFFFEHTPEGSRFVINNFDPKNKEIFISNGGVPHYGMPPIEPLNKVKYVIRKTKVDRINKA